MKHTDDLINLVTQHINIQSFYKGYFSEWNGNFNTKVRCPFHEDKDPSFKIYDAGNWKCFGCGASGGGPIAFEKSIKNIEFGQALRSLYSEHYQHIVDPEVLQLHRMNFDENPDLVERLERERGWTKGVMDALQLGFTTDRVKNTTRLTIPCSNRHGFVDCVYYYDVFGMREEGEAKTKPMVNSMAHGRLWPIGVLADHDDIVFCEGLGDVITAMSHDIAAVTVGSSSAPLNSADLRMLEGKNIAVCYDMDTAGRAGAKKMCDRLAGSGGVAGVRDVLLPMAQEDHTDLTDWLHHEGHGLEAFKTIVAATDFYKKDTPKVVSLRQLTGDAEDSGDAYPSSPFPTPKSPPFVSLRSLQSAKLYGKPFQTEAVVVGKAPLPIFAPKIVELMCRNPTAKCFKIGTCRFVNAVDHTIRVELDPWDPDTLSIMEGGKMQRLMAMKDRLGILKGCPLKYTMQKAYTVYKTLIAPPVGFDEAQANPETLQVLAFYFGDNIRSNIPYLFTGYTVEHPGSSEATAVLTEATSLATTLEAFEVTKEMVDSLAEFRVPEGADTFDHLMDYYGHCSRSLSGIVGRDLVHFACDLVFFSPVSFTFGDEFLRKGPLDVLVFGDPRTGKNCIVDSFQRHYQHGEVISGESCSPMNLIGGIKVTSEFRGLQWGRFVARHRDTIIVDEMSALATQHIGLLSRIRSEGIANVDKDGLHQHADAICGILWLSNPRDHRMLGQYSYGVKALKTLVPAPEDIARFDYVVAVASGEVPSGDINRTGRTREQHRFNQDQCHNLILWSKSRTPEQIKFSDETTAFIMEEAGKFGRTYTKEIPLTLAENMRFKLAKIAVAIAARTFSSDTTGEFLYVTKAHAQAGVTFLHQVYETETLGFKLYSDMAKAFSVLDEAGLEEKLRRHSEMSDISFHDMCALMVKHEQMSLEDMQSVLGLERREAGILRNLLVRYHCIVRKGNFYEKSNGFNTFLRKVVRRKGD